VELAVPHAEVGELAGDRLGEGRGGRAARVGQGRRDHVEAHLRLVALCQGSLEGITAGVDGLELGARSSAARQQLLEARGAVSPPQVGDAVEPLLHLGGSRRVGVEGVGEAP
jgi:hypothetical protein